MKHLEARRLSKRFSPSDPPAVDNASVELETSEILGIVGPSGCGKTTTLRMIAGFESPDSGDILLEGRSIVNLPPERRRIGLVFQDYALFPNRSVIRNVLFALHRTERADRRRRAEELLAMVGLQRERDRMPQDLSGGQQQRVALARALAADPELLLLDEPFSNLDAALRESTRREVRALLKRARVSTILVTHDQEEALSFCDTVAVMNAGRIEQTGPPEAVYLQPETPFVASFLGRSNLLDAQAHGDTAQTELGMVPLAGRAEGAIRVSLRPEHLMLKPVDEDVSPGCVESACVGEIVAREFRGHDITYRVRFHSTDYLVHTDYTADYQPGSLVYIIPRRPAVIL